MANPKFTKLQLSESANGAPIIISATSTAGTLVHTSISGTAEEDEIWLYATNIHSSNVQITIEFGDANSQNNIIETIPADDGLYLIIPGLILNGAKSVRIFAGTTNVIHVSGFVNRITD